MTIRRGEEWGSAVPRPEGLRVAGSDRELAALTAADSHPPLGVGGGDLFGTVGAPTDRDPMQRLPIDVLRIDADGESHVAVAHVVVRDRWLWGGILAVMNVDHLGRWNVAPRAHPNDGRFDVLEVDPGMPLRQRLQAWRRLPHGTHVPHPCITTRTGQRQTWEFDRPRRLFVDGEPSGSVQRLTVEVKPDAIEIHV